MSVTGATNDFLVEFKALFTDPALLTGSRAGGWLHSGSNTKNLVLLFCKVDIVSNCPQVLIFICVECTFSLLRGASFWNSSLYRQPQLLNVQREETLNTFSSKWDVYITSRPRDHHEIEYRKIARARSRRHLHQGIFWTWQGHCRHYSPVTRIICRRFVWEQASPNLSMDGGGEAVMKSQLYLRSYCQLMDTGKGRVILL